MLAAEIVVDRTTRAVLIANLCAAVGPIAVLSVQDADPSPYWPDRGTLAGRGTFTLYQSTEVKCLKIRALGVEAVPRLQRDKLRYLNIN